MFGGFYGWSRCHSRGLRCFLDFAPMRTLKCFAWFLTAFVLTVYVGLVSAQDLRIADRQIIYNSVKYTSPNDYCLARTPSTALYRCNNKGKHTGQVVDAWSTEGSPVNYTWFYGYCTTDNPQSCSPLSGTKPDRSCPSGKATISGPVAGERYCDVPPPCLPETQTESITWKMYKGLTNTYNPWANSPGAKNSRGCKVEIIEVEDCYTLPKSDDPSIGYCTFKARQSGGTANSGAPSADVGSDNPDKARDELPPTESKPDGSCPKGTVNAGLSASGIPMCIGQGTAPKNPPAAPPKVEVEKNETLPDGSQQTTKTETTKNADGSTTTTKTVTITKPSGEKETNQEKNTTKTPSGTPGKETVAPDKETQDLCKQNPTLNICKNSTVSGKCAETSCTGDAIQCATLRAAVAMECRVKADEEGLKDLTETKLGKSILAGNDPMKSEIDTVMKGTEIDLSKPGLDDTGFIGGGSCLPNKTMSVMGRPITVEFAQLCTNIQPLRGVIMACAFILAYMIVSRSVLQG